MKPALNILSGIQCFPSPTFCPQYPRLVFPPTLPIILDVITHYNVTHKGKRPLHLETDLHWTGYSHCTSVKERANELSLMHTSAHICIVITYSQDNTISQTLFIKCLARQRDGDLFPSPCLGNNPSLTA